jgi:hypothetical protein
MAPFRHVVEQKAIRRPILITHITSNKAVGIANLWPPCWPVRTRTPLGIVTAPTAASAAIVPKKTPEAQDGDLLRAGGASRFMAGQLHNLNALNAAGDTIKSHGDVRNHGGAHAVVS